MDIADIVTPDCVYTSLRAGSKKQALQEIADRAADITGLGARELFNALLQRERLGSTGIGHGIAIPHAKLEGIDRVHGLFVRLATPIDFDSADDEPVDLLFVLIAPMSAGANHLKALSRISRLLRNPAAVAKIRASRDAAAIHSVLVEPTASSNAA